VPRLHLNMESRGASPPPEHRECQGASCSEQAKLSPFAYNQALARSQAVTLCIQPGSRKKQSCHPLHTTRLSQEAKLSPFACDQALTRSQAVTLPMRPGSCKKPSCHPSVQPRSCKKQSCCPLNTTRLLKEAKLSAFAYNLILTRSQAVIL